MNPHDTQDSPFILLYKLDVNDKVEKKDTGTATLSYLSWTYAWAEVKKLFPNATYTIKKFENNLPYVFDPNTGYMVFTDVTIEGVTHEMWLPVMDSANKAMLNRSYTYEVAKYDKRDGQKVKVGTTQKTVLPATMFDVNKTIMRCLVKNLAMHGLGLYIFAGEDLPENEDGVFEKAKMTRETALKVKLTFGKHKGKTLGELLDSDQSYIKYLKENDRTAPEIKEAIRLIEEPETGRKPTEQTEQPTTSEVDGRIKNLLSELEQLGADTKSVQREYLRQRNLPNFDTYKKTDFLNFLTEIKQRQLDMMDARQGELMKQGTTTASTSGIDWGKS